MAAVCNLPFEAKKYLCGPIAQPMPGAVKAAFAKMIFFKGQKQITVGNQSSEGGVAFIKSFTYSFSNGAGVEAEIIDTSGSDFANFLTIMPSKECDPEKGSYSIVGVEFGWIFEDSNGGYKKYGSIEASYDESLTDTTGGTGVVEAGNYLWFMLTKLSVSEARGIWVYKMSLTSMLQSSAPFTKESKAVGSDDQKKELKPACEDIIKESCKNYFKQNAQEKFTDDAVVKFVRISSNFSKSGSSSGSTQRIMETFNFKASDGGPNGPKSVWAPEQQDSLSATRKWLNSFETDRNLGTYFISDIRQKKPTLLVMENPQDPCLASNECLSASIKPKKVYIVNGGNCSPVISFNPSIELIFIDPTTNISANPTGNATTKGTPEVPTQSGKSSQSKKGCSDKETDKKGLETSMSVPGSNLNFRTPDQANNKEFKSIWVNSNAAKMYEIISPVEADLVIEGDPRYLDLVSLQYTNIGIVYLNPYSVKNNGKDCDWTAYPNINEFFSRSSYMIKSTSHKIDESGYQTTLKLSSVVPNERKK